MTTHSHGHSTTRPYRPQGNGGWLRPPAARTAPAARFGNGREPFSYATAVTRLTAPYPPETTEGLSTTEQIHRNLFSHYRKG